MFKEYDCKVLVSRDPEVPGKTMTRVIFGTCGNTSTANSGLYMGYAKYVKQFIDEAVAMKCEDDQKNLNTVCQNNDFIKVDEEETIFKNFGPLDKKQESNAIFVSYPGSPGISRYSRSIIEYTQFVYIYIMSLLILGLAFFPQQQNVLLSMLILYTAFYAFVADKSCTFHPR